MSIKKKKKISWRKEEKIILLVCFLLIFSAGFVSFFNYHVQQVRAVDSVYAYKQINRGSSPWGRGWRWSFTSNYGASTWLKSILWDCEDSKPVSYNGNLTLKVWVNPSGAPIWSTSSGTVYGPYTGLGCNYDFNNTAGGSNTATEKDWNNGDIEVPDGATVYFILGNGGNNPPNGDVKLEGVTGAQINTGMDAGFSAGTQYRSAQLGGSTAAFPETGDVAYVFVEAYTTPPNAAPTVTFNSQAQKTDGTGTVDVSVEVDDDDDDDVKLKVEYKAGADCSSGTSDPTLDEAAGSTADTSDSGGTPSVENDDTYQVGTTATRLIDTGSGINTVTFDWSSATDVASADGTYCIKITPNDGTTDGTAATETLTLDNADPTAAGNLTLNTLATTSLTYDFGVAGSDTNIDHYEVYYKAGASGVATSDTQIGSNIASGSYNADGTTSVSSLSANTQYVANIWTYDSYGNSGASSEVAAYTAAAVPGAPTVDNMNLTGGDVTLDVNGNPGSTEFAIQETSTGFYVQADGSLSGSADWQDNATWGTVTVTGASANTQYTFQVKARNGDSTETAFGSTASAYTLANQTTSVSVANATTKTGYGVALTWSDNSQTGMKIEQDTDCDASYETSVYDNASANETSPLSITSLAGNACYQFRISSYNGDGVLNSTSIPTSSQITTPPAQPTSLTVLTNSTNSIAWSWDSVTGATDYNVYNNSGDSLIGNVGSSQSAYAQESLSANTAYTVYVRPTNANGTGIASSTATGYTEANIPINMSHTSQATDSVRWTWESGGSQKEYYADSTDPVDNIAAWTTSAYWDQSSLTANYLVVARARARNLNDEATSNVSISRYTSQNTPSGITEGGNTISSITVTAAGTFPNLTDGSSGLYFENTTSSTNSGWTQTNSWANSSLSANTAYAYKVKARNGDTDVTAYSGTTTIYSAQNAPTATNIDSKTATTVTMSATGTFPNLAVGNSGLYFENTTASTDSGWLQVNTYVDSSLSVNTPYTYKVKARNGDSDETAETSTVTVYTLANVPAVPTLANTEMINTDVIINVNSNPSTTDFAIYDSETTKYVTAGGELTSDTAVWQTYSEWGGSNGITVTGLNPGWTYSFKVKAKNGDAVETALSSTGSAQMTAPAGDRWSSWGTPTDQSTQEEEVPGEDVIAVDGETLDVETGNITGDEVFDTIEEIVIEEEVIVEVVEEDVLDEPEQVTSSSRLRLEDVLNEIDRQTAKKIIEQAENQQQQDEVEVIIVDGNGSDEPIREMTARERLGLVADFYDIYGRVPENSDLETLDNMAYAEKPDERNIDAERKAISEFIRVYGRVVNLRDQSDNDFVEYLAYRLRPQDRDLGIEKVALGRFVSVYRSLPANGWTWSIVRAIAYSGVK